jgi:hypothetical protein
MRTRMTVIVAAMGAAVLASPATAGNWRTAPVPLSTNNVYWGLGYRGYAHQHLYGHEHGYGAAAYPELRAPGAGNGGVRPQIDDCIHVTFPQCSGGG